jgi:hypothetical protein
MVGGEWQLKAQTMVTGVSSLGRSSTNAPHSDGGSGGRGRVAHQAPSRQARTFSSYGRC